MITGIDGWAPQKQHSPTRRRIHFVDIENIIGGAVQRTEDAVWARMQIERLVGSTAGDHVVLGSSHFSALNCWRVWESAQRVWGSGKDGADLRLLREMKSDYIARRFDEVVLSSGDGIFVDAVKELQACGTYVILIAPFEGCSKRLRMVANEVRFLERLYVNEGGAA